jgi:hypothetical protein
VKVGTYRVQVDVRGLGRPVAKDVSSKVIPFLVAGQPATSLTVQQSAQSPQTVGGSVTFTAAGVGGGPYEYRFWLRAPGTGWAIAQAYSTVDTFTWTPVQPGRHQIQVDVRAVGTTVARDVMSTIQYIVTGAIPTGVALNQPNVASPQSILTGLQPVVFTANPNNAGTYEYKFWIKEPAAGWRTARAYNTQNSWTWIPPAKAGTYTIQVDIRPVGSAITRSFQATTTYVINP